MIISDPLRCPTVTCGPAFRQRVRPVPRNAKLVKAIRKVGDAAQAGCRTGQLFPDPRTAGTGK